MALLDQIPGVDRKIATIIVAELGVDMAVFESPSKLASWVGVCPGNNESAGKRKPSSSLRGNTPLKCALVEAANAATRTRHTYYREKFFRLKARRGYQRAMVALAHKLLIVVYHMLLKGIPFQELGEQYLDAVNKHQLSRSLVRRLERLGYNVILQPQAA